MAGLGIREGSARKGSKAARNNQSSSLPGESFGQTSWGVMEEKTGNAAATKIRV